MILVLIELKLQSNLPERKDLFSTKLESKDYVIKEMYLKTPHILLYSEKSKSMSTLLDLNDYSLIGKSEILNPHAKIKLLPKGEKIIFYKAKDDKYFLDHFRYEDLEGTIQKSAKVLESEMGQAPEKKTPHPLSSALEMTNQNKPAVTNLCLRFRDSSFGEAISQEAPASKIKIIEERNVEFISYRIAKDKLQKNIQILKSDLKGSADKMEQCLTIQVSDLKYYLMLRNFYW